MRIGINLLSWEPGQRGGVETYDRSLLRALLALESGDSFVLFLSQEARGAAELQDPRLEKLYCPVQSRRRLRRALWEQARLGAWIERSGVEVLFCPHGLLPGHCPVPMVQLVHDLQVFDLPQNFPWWKRAYLYQRLPASARRAARILTVSEFTRQSVLRHLGTPADKVVTILEAAPPEFTPRPEAEIAARCEQHGLRRPYVLSLATSHKHKRLDRLVAVFDRLVGERGWEVRLALAGLAGSGEKELREALGRARHPEAILHLGRLPAEELPALYSGALGYVFPSLYEGFGLPLLEAMACGCPVLSSDAASLPEVAAGAALLYAGQSEEAMGEGLWRLVEEPQLRDELREKGYRRAGELSWAKTARATLEALRVAAGLG